MRTRTELYENLTDAVNACDPLRIEDLAWEADDDWLVPTHEWIARMEFLRAVASVVEEMNELYRAVDRDGKERRENGRV